MARKVFISFLGANAYDKAFYYNPSNKEEFESFYVQEALARLICKDWDKESQFIVFTTALAKKNNWDGRIGRVHPYTPSNGEIKTSPQPMHDDGLKRYLEVSFSGKAVQVDIENGVDEAEIWGIFSTILDTIQEKDIVHLDITNAFRFMPTFATVLLDFAKLIKEIEIGGIYYGNFEAKKDIKNPNKDKAPILNLTNIYELQEWTSATNIFVKGGDAQYLEPLIKKTDVNLANSLKEFTTLLAICRGGTLNHNFDIDSLKENILNNIQSSTIQKQLQSILEKITNKLAPFATNKNINAIHAVQWCIDHQLYQQGYTFLEESLKTLLLETVASKPQYQHWQPHLLEKGVKNAAQQALKCSTINAIEGQMKEFKHIQDANDFAKELSNVATKWAISDFYNKLIGKCGLRNDINHAGMIPKANTAGNLVKELQSIYDDIVSALTQQNIL